MHTDSQTNRSASAGRHRRARGAQEQPLLVDLQRRFAEFRTHRVGGSRVPEELRARAIAALEEGVTPAELQRTCGVAWSQVVAWQAGRNRPTDAPASPPPKASTEPPAVRVFKVVDAPKAPSAPALGRGDTLELKVGPWAVSVRLVERGT